MSQSSHAYSPRGRHCIGELWGASIERLKDLEGVMSELEGLLTSYGFTVVGRAGHSFPEPGGGFTGLVLLSESHASIHTYPEHRYAAVDLFSCGALDPHPVLEAFALTLGVKRPHLKTITRGERGSEP